MLLIFNQNQINSLDYIQISSYERMYRNMALAVDNPSVTQNSSEVKNTTGANNYTSFATYYHPDTSSPTGFPYVRKDGVRNKDLDNMSDTKYLNSLCTRLSHLSLLYSLTKNEEYADKAISIITTFFINPETKMNPTLTYSGLVIGDSMSDLKIRGATIDTSRLCGLSDWIELLKVSPSWNNDLQDAMVSWVDSLANWFKTDERGILQGGYFHNIKTSYMNQLASYLVFCGKESEAKAYLEANVGNLLSAQINSEGEQVLEMERAIPRHYSNFNLILLMRLVKICNSLGIDIKNYEDSKGCGSIKKAMLYMVDPGNWGNSNEPNDPIMTRLWIRDGISLYNDPVLSSSYDSIKISNFFDVMDYACSPS
jgi:hypothetical protein